MQQFRGASTHSIISIESDYGYGVALEEETMHDRIYGRGEDIIRQDGRLNMMINCSHTCRVPQSHNMSFGSYIKTRLDLCML